MNDEHLRSALDILGEVQLIRGGRNRSSSSSENGGGGGPLRASTELDGKVILLYFSASWCPPCRKFTPVLAGLYDELKAKANEDDGVDGGDDGDGDGGGKKEDFEIIFVSRDDDESKHDEYTEEMPWLAVPFGSKDAREKLVQKYGAKSIPHLVVIDADGRSVITEDGTEEVRKDDKGENFPWRPAPFRQVWPHSIVGRDGTVIPSSDLSDKYLMLYFSASWCSPCRRFTPVLSSAYEEMKAKPYGSTFEVAFVSSDKSKSQYDEYRAEMPFPALSYGERDGCCEEKAGRGCLIQPILVKRFRVRGIPQLVVLSPEDGRGERRVVNDDARDVIERGELDDFPFHRRASGGGEKGRLDVEISPIVEVLELDEV